MQFHIKDPDAVLDYSVNWDAGYLQSGESLASSSWTISPAGMTQTSAANTAGMAAITVSGGAAGRRTMVQCSRRLGPEGRRRERGEQLTEWTCERAAVVASRALVSERLRCREW